MRTIDFSYQIKAANKVLVDAMDKKYRASVLAACPNAGKTTISHHIINMALAKNPTAKIVVLTEGQNTLKNQYISELEKPNVPITFSFGDFASNAQVRIGIPQSIDQLDWKEIDLLIVDEAQNFYHAPMVQDIIKRFSVKYQILMTGSPTKYNLHNQTHLINKYAIYYISAEDLQDFGVFSGVDVDVVRTKDKKNPIEAIKSCMQEAYNKNDDLSKIMIACPNIAYAQSVATFMTMLGRKVSLSTSKNDPDDVEINKFKSDDTDVLIVVNKGVLGFNDKYMTVLFDMRSTSNLDASYQLFARVLRTHPKDLRKTYYRLADSDYNKQVLTLHRMIALMKRDIFMGYNGKNLKLEAQYA